MLYHTNKARQSHIDKIGELIATISTIPGDKLNYTDATAITRYLSTYRDLIEKEQEKEKNTIAFPILVRARCKRKGIINVPENYDSRDALMYAREHTDEIKYTSDYIIYRPDVYMGEDEEES